MEDARIVKCFGTPIKTWYHISQLSVFAIENPFPQAAIDNGKVYLYRKVIEEGCAIPSIVLVETQDVNENGYILIDGPERLEAHKSNGDRFIDAYVIAYDADLPISILRGFWKQAIPSETTFTLGRYLVEEQHKSRKAAALICGIETGAALSDFINGSVVSERLVKLRFPHVNVIKHAVLKRLVSIKDDRVLKAMALLIYDADLEYKEVNNLVTELNEGRSESDRMTVVSSYRASADVQLRIANIKAGRTPRQADGLTLSVKRSLRDASEKMAKLKDSTSHQEALIKLAALRELIDVYMQQAKVPV